MNGTRLEETAQAIAIVNLDISAIRKQEAVKVTPVQQDGRIFLPVKQVRTFVNLL